MNKSYHWLCLSINICTTVQPLALSISVCSNGHLDSPWFEEKRLTLLPEQRPSSHLLAYAIEWLDQTATANARSESIVCSRRGVLEGACSALVVIIASAKCCLASLMRAVRADRDYQPLIPIVHWDEENTRIGDKKEVRSAMYCPSYNVVVREKIEI